jgi:hypothetical protein
MKAQSNRTLVIAATVILASAGLNAVAQVKGSAKSNSAANVAAEVTKGKLNPAESKPGDTIAVRLKDDVKSDGEVVLKKGTTITGVVRNVKHAEAKSSAKGDAKGQAQSMMEIEWLVPSAQGKAAQNLSFTLQSVSQVNPIYRHEQQAAEDIAFAGAGSASTAARPVPAGAANAGGLLGGTVAATTGVVGATTGVVGATAGTVGATTGVVAGTVGAGSQSSAALLSAPTVVAADQQTSSMIASNLGSSSSGQLFKVGQGQLVTAGGSQQSVDIFSRLNNDTVITSASRNFEISSGAQMQMLVGVNRK